MPDLTSDQTQPNSPPSEAVVSELARLGIVEVPVTFFGWGGYRYSNVHDAIAAARRSQR
jgi:hypothetical protein